MAEELEVGRETETVTEEHPRSPRELSIIVGIPHEEQKIERSLPPEYVQRTLGDGLYYVLNQADLTEQEKDLAEMIRDEMASEHILQAKVFREREGRVVGEYVNVRKSDTLSKYIKQDTATGKGIVDLMISGIDEGGSSSQYSK